MQRKDTRSQGVRPGLFSPKLALWSGSYLIGTTGCVHQGQCVVACLPSLWSTGTKAKCGYHGSGCYVRGSPPPVLRDSVLCDPSHCPEVCTQHKETESLGDMCPNPRHTPPSKPERAKVREAQGAMKQRERTSLRPLGRRGRLSRLERPSLLPPTYTQVHSEPAKPAPPSGLSVCARSSQAPRAASQPPPQG